MTKDPQSINKNTKIMVKLLAEIINDFFEPLTYKSLGFIVLTTIGLVALSGYCNKGTNNNRRDRRANV